VEGSAVPFDVAGTDGTACVLTSTEIIWEGWNTVTSSTTITDDTWRGWTSGTYVTTPSITYTDTVWDTWTDSTITAPICTEIIWQVWIDENGENRLEVVDGSGSVEPQIAVPPPARIYRLKDIRKKRKKRKKAEKLLASILSIEQWREWKLYRSVRVRGSEGGFYEIGPGWSGMVYSLHPETAEPLKKLCVHPSGAFCIEDRVATLALMIMTDEPKLLATANNHCWNENEMLRVRLRRAHRSSHQEVM
jgi:hypothetical protein